MTDKRAAFDAAAIVAILTLLASVFFGVYDRWLSPATIVAIPPAGAVSSFPVAPAPQMPSASTNTFLPASPMPEPSRVQPVISTAASSAEPQRIQPSFSCELPATRYQPFERAICNSSTLSEADLALEATYLAVRKRATIQQRAWLKTEQRSWMTSRSQCRDDACLLSLYQQRSAELTNLYR